MNDHQTPSQNPEEPDDRLVQSLLSDRWAELWEDLRPSVWPAWLGPKPDKPRPHYLIAVDGTVSQPPLAITWDDVKAMHAKLTAEAGTPTWPGHWQPIPGGGWYSGPPNPAITTEPCICPRCRPAPLTEPPAVRCPHCTATSQDLPAHLADYHPAAERWRRQFIANRAGSIDWDNPPPQAMVETAHLCPVHHTELRWGRCPDCGPDEDEAPPEPDWHKGCTWCWRTIWHTPTEPATGEQP